MKILTILVAAVCAVAIYHAISAKQTAKVELVIPTSAVISAHYDHTKRTLQQMGEGFD